MTTDVCATLLDLRKVIDTLTGPGGCPWDMAQTPESLAEYVIEESHELVAAIRSGNPGEVCEELGDVAFLLFFIAAYFEKKKIFSLAEAFEKNAEKMKRRHPHVYGNSAYATAEEHLKTWEAIKKQEHQEQGQKAGLYSSLPQSLPPLIKAYRIHSKAARAGFTWPEDEEVEQQVESEWLELLDAFSRDDKNAWRHEFGDLLFSLVELGRRRGLKASEALDLACRRFVRRYEDMEALAEQDQRDLADLTLDEKDELWEKTKKAESRPEQDASS